MLPSRDEREEDAFLREDLGDTAPYAGTRTGDHGHTVGEF
jgi:hypothetical protein